MVWYSHLLKNFPQFDVIQTVKGLNIINKAEAEVFLEFSCFFACPVTFYQMPNIMKGVHQGCILSPCLFNFYAEYITQNAGLDETQAGIKIARRNTNSLRYADDTTLMAETEEELKGLLMKVKEESEKVCLTLNIQKTKTMASSPISLWQIDGETMEQ